MIKYGFYGGEVMSMKLFRKLGVITVILVGLGTSFQLLIKTVNAAKNEISWPAIVIVPLVSGLSSPVHISNAGDGSNRLFVVERVGRIRVVENGVLSVTPFLDIQDRTQSTGGEEGLLSIAFPQDYATHGYFYVYYTNKNGDNQVSRFHTSANPDLAEPNSEELILYLEHPSHSNHNGGQLAFGQDGYLYIGTGDGGGGGDPDENAQDPASLLGKILRIDVSPAMPGGSDVIFLPILVGGNEFPANLSYRIPPDNPFVNVPGYRGEIWALGLRNPWRFSFDRQTGDLFIGDVGQGSWEEVDFQLATSQGGENYGWNEMEGTHCYLLNCETSGMTLPVYEYPTHVDGSCAVTGGFVYRGLTYDGMQGIYFLGDYCNGVITGLQMDGSIWQNQLLLDTNINISSFGEDESGEVYLADIATGTIYHLIEQTP